MEVKAALRFKQPSCELRGNGKTQKLQGQLRLELWPYMLLCETTKRLGKGLNVTAEKDHAIKYSHGVQEVSLEAVFQPGNGITLHEEKNEMYHYVFF